MAKVCHSNLGDHAGVSQQPPYANTGRETPPSAQAQPTPPVVVDVRRHLFPRLPLHPRPTPPPTQRPHLHREAAPAAPSASACQGTWVVRRSLTLSSNGLCRGSLGSARILACCLRHPAANLRHRATSHPTDVEVLMAVGRERLLSASPPDHPVWTYPGLTRMRLAGLVQPLGCATNPLQGLTSD